MDETTTYDDILTSFITNCKVSRKLIPTNEDILKEWIQNGIKLYNNKMKKYEDDFNYPIMGDDVIESLDVKLTDDELLILINIMKLVFLKNEKTLFVSKYGVFQKEFGINNYNAQANSKDLEITEQEKTIDDLIVNALDDWSPY